VVLGFGLRLTLLSYRCVKRPFLIDTDTASDDAVALIMALRCPEVEVVAITTVAGNVGVEQASRNALYTAELCESSVPVFAGAEKPLTREHASASWFHGRDGLGDHGYPPPRRAVERQSATDAIIATIESQPGLVLVTLGPLTNIALALQKRPEIAGRVGRCVVMGGAPCCEGNVTPAAEYNIWCDPEAARIVIRSGLPIELVGWHLCRGEAYFQQTGEHGISLPDPVSMAVALDPSIVTSQTEHYVEIETVSELTRGMTVVDRLNVTNDERNREVWAEGIRGRSKAKIVWAIDNARWKQTLYAALQ
jgi:purine nucleosidase